MSNRFLSATVMSLVLLVVLAGSAQAATWKVGGSKLEAGATEAISSKLKSSKLTLEGTVLESPLKIAATGVECMECQIKQVGSGPSASADRTGKVKLTGVSVVEPAGCSASPIIIIVVETFHVAIKGPKGIFEMHGTVIEIFEFETLVTIKITGCAAAGSYKLTGSLDGQTNGTGVLSTSEPLTYSPAIQKEEKAVLKLGGNEAFLTGEIATQLSGANSGKEFGVVE
jgi:hypothetical protein